MNFTSGMSHLDYKSMIRGQQAIKIKNQTSRADFLSRFEEALEGEKVNPTCTSIDSFCLKHGFSKRTLYKPHNRQQLDKLKELQGLRPRGNPHGWKKNAWYV